MIAVLTFSMVEALVEPVVAQPRFEVFERSIGELQAAQAAGQVTSRQLVEQYLARIAAYDRSGPGLNAIVMLNPHALAEADRLDQERRRKGARGPLHGVPILLKDNYATVDMPTSGGTLALANMSSAADATVVQRLRDAGAVILGKTTLQELAVGVTTVSSLTGETKNPYDLARSPGGSSGGSAAAVAASFAAAATGSDTCGSIRIPPAFQNLYGLRSTQGLVSRAGLVPISSSQDVAGPIARTVGDIAVLLDVMAGDDPADPTTRGASLRRPASYAGALQADGLRGARIGVLRDLFTAQPEDANGLALSNEALRQMAAQGAAVVDISVPGFEAALRDTSSIVFEFKYELSAFLKQHPGAAVTSLQEIIDQGLDHEIVDARFRQRNAPLARDELAYARVLGRRKALQGEILKVMRDNRLDALVYPVSLQTPPLVGQSPAGGGGSCQLSASTGLPAMAIPIGFVDGLPMGMELLGAPFSEPTLLKLAFGWEQSIRPRKPPFSTPPLIDGRAPKDVHWRVRAKDSGQSLSIKASYAPTTGVLDLTSTISGLRPEDVTGVKLHYSRNGGVGPIFGQALGRGRTREQVRFTLTAQQRDQLASGSLIARLYTRQSPLGSLRLKLQTTAARDLAER